MPAEVSRVIAAATGLTLRQPVGTRGVEAAASGGQTIPLSEDARVEPDHPLPPFASRWAALISLSGAACDK